MKAYEKDVILTSGYNFEGYKITKYIDFCTGECALGTGFLSSLGASFADFFGSSSGMYEGKLLKAKRTAISDLKRTAYKLGANAIIGLDVDYTVFSQDIIGVVAGGTAVLIEPLVKKEYIPEYTSTQESILKNEMEQEQIFIIPANNYYIETPIRPYAIQYNETTKSLKMQFGKYSESDITAMNVNITFDTIFHTQSIYNDINFTSINFTDDHLETEYVPFNIPVNLLKIINSCSIVIQHYIENKICKSPDDLCFHSELTLEKLLKLRKECGNDVVTDFIIAPDHWTCICGKLNSMTSTRCDLCDRKMNTYEPINNAKFDPRAMLQAIEDLKTAVEIVNYIDNVDSYQCSILSEEVINEIRSFAKSERMYGNMKDSCIKKIRQYLNITQIQ